MDALAAVVITIEIVVIIIGSIIGIINNIKFIKRKLGMRNKLLLWIFVYVLGLIALISGIVAFVHLGIPIFSEDTLTIWGGIVVLVMAIVVDCYKYQKIKKEEADKNMEEHGKQGDL